MLISTRGTNLALGATSFGVDRGSVHMVLANQRRNRE